MNRMFAVMVAVAAMSPSIDEAEQTWTGTISDAICGKSHVAMAGQIGISDRDCTVQCAQSGSKYVLVDDKGTVLAFANQTFTGLEEHADRVVKVTGDLKDGAIVVSKIEIAAGST